MKYINKNINRYLSLWDRVEHERKTKYQNIKVISKYK